MNRLYQAVDCLVYSRLLRPGPLHRRLLYGAVWPGEDHCLVAIIKTHPVRWGAFGSQYLDDLGRPMGLADRAAVHVQVVADPCLHDLSPRGRRGAGWLAVTLRAPAATLKRPVSVGPSGSLEDRRHASTEASSGTAARVLRLVRAQSATNRR